MAKGFNRRGGFPMGGMGAGNMNNLMKQAQKLQRDMQEAQAKAAEMVGESSVGGGAITLKVDANHQITELVIKPEIVDPEDTEMLQDLFVAAVNEAMRDLDEKVEGCMGSVSGLAGMGGMLGL